MGSQTEFGNQIVSAQEIEQALVREARERGERELQHVLIRLQVHDDLAQVDAPQVRGRLLRTELQVFQMLL